MKAGTMFAPMEVKFASDAVTTGSFEGYGAVFGNIDAYGDVIVPGAFKETLRDWKKQKRLPPMLVQHGGWMMSDDDGIPIGKWTVMEEDEKGLRVEGRLINLDTERGKRIYGAMKEGVLDGMSIGYSAKEFELGTKPDEPRRKLKKIDLFECSVVTFPANRLSRVTDIKGGASMSVREFEAFLRDEGGFSHARAKEIIQRGYKTSVLRDEDDDVGELADIIRRNIANLKAKG